VSLEALVPGFALDRLPRAPVPVDPDHVRRILFG
jgi:hypothetical protein